MANNKLINCPTCGKEISKTASTCPHCGEVLKQKKSSSGAGCGCLIALIAFGAIFAASSSITKYTNNSIQSQVSGVTDESEYITLSEYNQITTGMTYEEVCSIVGSNGTESASSGDDNYKIVIVTWYGNGVAGSNANVTFTNGAVTGKAQVGLQ
jgi:hypothetical protein